MTNITHNPQQKLSADRYAVLQAALDLQRRALADIALKAFAVIADRFDDAHGPIVGKPHAGAEFAFDAEQAADIRIVRLHHVVDILLGDAELFGIDHSVMGPAHDVFPVVIALAHGGSERLFGNDFRQHYIGAGIGQPQPLAVEAGGVRRIGIAAAAV